MPVTNFPGGVASMGVPLLGGEDALPAAPIWWVCNRTGVINGDGKSADRPLPALADAMVRLTASNPYKGEEIRILPGHAENITGANILSGSTVNTSAVVFVKGLRIRGYGDGALRPTFTFTATTSKLTLDAESVSIENCIFTADPAVNTAVTLGFNITAVNCAMRRCYFVPAVAGPMGLFTTLMQIGSSANNADGFAFEDNEMFAPELATDPTNLVKVHAVANRVAIRRNVIQAATSATDVGCINVAVAATALDIAHNTIVNLKASSTCCVLGTAAMTGFIRNNVFGTQAVGASANNITCIKTPGNVFQVENYVASLGKVGQICGAAEA